MNTQILIDGLVLFIGFVALTAFHEFAHAWTAVRCGDDTPRWQGRLTLDPLAHIDWLGTVILPLVLVVAGAATGHLLFFGWGRPVEVNLANFRQRRRDDILVSAAGPVMNLVCAIVILGLAKVLELAGYAAGVEVAIKMAQLSLFLCFFNLLPIPPLDGGHIMRNLVGLSDETYAMLGQYSFIFLFLIMRSTAVSDLMLFCTERTLLVLARPFGLDL